MSIKIAFFDIDWTLYDHFNHRFSPTALSSLKKLAYKGDVKIFLCTARPYDSLVKLGTMGLGIKFDGYIASNGGIAVAEGQYLRKILMDDNDIQKFRDKSRYFHQVFEYVTPTSRFLSGKANHSAELFYQSFVEEIPAVKDYAGEEVTGFNFFAPKEYDKRYCSLFPKLTYRRYFPVAVDVTPLPSDKGIGIDNILSHYGYSKNEAIGFGDDIQDLAIANRVGIFVAMGNGKDEVKKAADFVTKAVNEDGIEFALRHYSLI